jgi:hypothetical protein
MKRHGNTKNAQQTLERLAEQMKINTAPPKFCVNCQWHSFKSTPTKEDWKYLHFCNYPPLLDVITGKPSNPAKNRNDATMCGKAARHFAPKQGKAI